ncbi:MAG TPA: FlgD immunoglobulin-like domain containing protein [Steroidobacteraceae bacterium]|nr:FlgD immunoglobulin-like domain containing protein [Steroidobacteraceae bacterium]
MSTNPIGSVPAATAGAAGAASSAQANGAGTAQSSSLPSNLQISQAGFLQLITAQMQNQNPLDPTDPTQFLTQIEGLSEVSSLQSLQGSISGLASSLQSAQVLSGTSLLGHSVLAPGSIATLASGGTVSGAVSAPTGTRSLTVSISDASGALVSAFNLAPQASGLTNFTWNGATSSGGAAPAGQYTVNVTAAVGGANQSVSPLVYSKVNSVTIDPATQALDLNTVNGTVALSSVVSVE